MTVPMFCMALCLKMWCQLSFSMKMDDRSATSNNVIIEVCAGFACDLLLQGYGSGCTGRFIAVV